MEYVFNNVYVRILVGIFIGLPVTATSVIAGAHGLILGYAGLIKADFGLVLFGLLTIAGFIGIGGAWRRLLESTTSMSDKAINKTRAMLFFGLITSAILSAWAVYSYGLSVISLPLIALILGSVMFIMATPKKL